MADLEKQAMEDVMQTPAPVPTIAGPGIQELLIQNEGGTVAATNPHPKKWLMSWLLISFSAIALISHLFPESEDDAERKNKLISPGLAMFVVFLCAICLIFRTTKQMM